MSRLIFLSDEATIEIYMFLLHEMKIIRFSLESGVGSISPYTNFIHAVETKQRFYTIIH